MAMPLENENINRDISIIIVNEIRRNLKIKNMDKRISKEMATKMARLSELHQELIKSIFRKIPDLVEEKEVYINKGAFQTLTDEELVVLWSLPNIVIKVSKNAADYLEERRILLGLKRAEQSGVLKSNRDRIDGT